MLSKNFLSYNLQNNEKILHDRFKNSVDIIFYRFEIFTGLKALVVYISDIVEREELERNVFSILILNPTKMDFEDIEPTDDFIKKILPVSNIEEENAVDDAVNGILNGNVALLVDGIDQAFILPFNNVEKRAIEEPETESVTRGPKEGFIESINVNRTMIRRKIKNENLIFESLEIGRQTKTTINIAYIEDIVSDDVLAEVRKRLDKIDTDSILDAGYIEEFIEDSHISPISTVGNTQKPDIVAAKILEGRVAILCDGFPHVLTVPHLFVESIQACEDYYQRPYIATLLRFVRMFALILSVILPAFYVALETFHQDMIPTVLLISMVGANQGTPFPAFLEALLMISAFEFLKESGTRMPKVIGSAISIVGALVLGDAAVKAGIVSADLIVVIAFTAVSTFIIPSLNEMVTLYRLILLALAGIMGLYGVAAGVFMMIIHAASLRSFGVPYLSPLAPANLQGLKDSIIRFPIWSMRKRPKSISKKNSNRRG